MVAVAAAAAMVVIVGAIWMVYQNPVGTAEAWLKPCLTLSNLTVICVTKC